MNGVYWGLTAMDLMGALDEMCRDEVISFVAQCQHECGGFRASIGHDPSLLCTLSAIQVVTCLSFYCAMHFSAKRGIAIACCLSVCNIGGSGLHRLEILETNGMDN